MRRVWRRAAGEARKKTQRGALRGVNGSAAAPPAVPASSASRCRFVQGEGAVSYKAKVPFRTRRRCRFVQGEGAVSYKAKVPLSARQRKLRERERRRKIFDGRWRGRSKSKMGRSLKPTSPGKSGSPEPASRKSCRCSRFETSRRGCCCLAAATNSTFMCVGVPERATKTVRDTVSVHGCVCLEGRVRQDPVPRELPVAPFRIVKALIQVKREPTGREVRNVTTTTRCST